MQGADDDAYQPPDSLCAPPHVGYDSDYGGREPPPPLMTFLRYVCTMVGTQQTPSHHRPLKSGHITENAQAVRGGGTGECSDRITGVWSATGDSVGCDPDNWLADGEIPPQGGVSDLG